VVISSPRERFTGFAGVLIIEKLPYSSQEEHSLHCCPGPAAALYFTTGTRWMPFVHNGAGVTSTSIWLHDLGGAFEFNLRAGVGIPWFFRNNVALAMEARYIPFSCAGLHHPNLGLNGIAGTLGKTYFF